MANHVYSGSEIYQSRDSEWCIMCPKSQCRQCLTGKKIYQDTNLSGEKKLFRHKFFFLKKKLTAHFIYYSHLRR